MMRLTFSLICLSLSPISAFETPAIDIPSAQIGDQQKVIRPLDSPSITTTKRKLHGRFLHITDMHPDRHYKAHSSTQKSDSCHHGKGEAGHYGAALTECGSPISLFNATFDWIRKELKDNIDFVIWTGDSARHDNDGQIPRSRDEVIGLNELAVDKFVEVFGNDNPSNPFDNFEIPIVPTLGNNDILPHNIFRIGPNRWTKTYLEVWRKMIPEAQRHQFDTAGWFDVEVIPGQLVVFSLNTMYLFAKNAAVDGCSQRTEPGYRQFEWLRIQLQFLRERNMKAMIIGHVPPARTAGKQYWDETCWQKYALWMRQFRDVVVGSFYGHMNIDHFLVQDFDDIDPKVERGHDPRTGTPDTINIESKQSYLLEMRDAFARLPKMPKSLRKGKSDRKSRAKEDKYYSKIGGRYGERFAVSHVSPSVIPNFFPSLRVYTYNISGLAEALPRPLMDPIDLDSDELGFDINKKKKKPKKRKHHRFTVPDGPDASSPPGPAYSPQPLSLMSWTQYYANLTEINAAYEADVGVAGRHAFEYQVLYNTRDDDEYGLDHLAVSDHIALAQQIGGSIKGKSSSWESYESVIDGETTMKKRKQRKHRHRRKMSKIWYTFLNRAFVGAYDEAHLEEDFGP